MLVDQLKNQAVYALALSLDTHTGIFTRICTHLAVVLALNPSKCTDPAMLTLLLERNLEFQTEQLSLIELDLL